MTPTEHIRNAWSVVPTPRGIVDTLKGPGSSVDTRLAAMQFWLITNGLIEDGDLEGPSAVLTSGQLDGILALMALPNA